MQNNTAQHKHKPKEFIDFSKLSNHELTTLSRKWESAAKVFEYKIDYYRNSKDFNQEKLDRLWQVAGKLWRRLATLEKWRRRNGKN